MKKYIIHIALVLIFPLIIAAQDFSTSDQKSSSKPKQEKESEKEAFIEFDKKELFIDKDGDGIDDRKMPQAREKQTQSGERKMIRERNRDRFIDRDGDGINDRRCRGMGLGNRERAGKKAGENQGAAIRRGGR